MQPSGAFTRKIKIKQSHISCNHYLSEFISEVMDDQTAKKRNKIVNAIGNLFLLASLIFLIVIAYTS